MKTKPIPDSEPTELPFLNPEAVPELDEFLTGMDDVDDLLKELGDVPGIDDLIQDAATANDQALFDEMAKQIRKDIDALLGPEERTVSKLLGAYTPRKPARRCHRPRRRGENS